MLLTLAFGILVIALVIYLVGLIPLAPILAQAFYVVIAVLALAWLYGVVTGHHFVAGL